MIINVQHIRQSRAIALNIDEISKLEPYIKEVEELWVMPAITPELYFKIDNTVTKLDDLHPATNNDNILELSSSEYSVLLLGGYYDANTKYCVGLVKAVAYLAYSRALLQSNVSFTAFGAVKKIGNNSEPLDDKTLARVAKDAEKTGQAYLQQCVNYIKFTELDQCSVTIKRRKKFKAIGN